MARLSKEFISSIVDTLKERQSNFSLKQFDVKQKKFKAKKTLRDRDR